MSYNSRTADKFVVRLPDGMRTQIDALAKEQHISMNSWMIQNLEAALKGDVVLPKPGRKTNPSWVPKPGEIVEYYNEDGEFEHLVAVDSVRVFIDQDNTSTLLIDASYYTKLGRGTLLSIDLTRFNPL